MSTPDISITAASKDIALEAQRKIPPNIKRELIEQAGKKCANPGCSNWRSHIHHIKHWAVYKAHASAAMIAVCPSCHDQIHNGTLSITDADLYQWKSISRPIGPKTAHVYVEPATELSLLTGSIALITPGNIAVFGLSNINTLKVQVLDQEFLQVTSNVHTLDGTELLRVVENHVRVGHNPEVLFEFRPGRAKVTVPASASYIPLWTIECMRRHEPTYASDGRVTAFDMTVQRPGVVRVEGFWPSYGGVTVITQEALTYCRQGGARPTRIMGDGEGSRLHFSKSITSSMFMFA